MYMKIFYAYSVKLVVISSKATKFSIPKIHFSAIWPITAI